MPYLGSITALFVDMFSITMIYFVYCESVLNVNILNQSIQLIENTDRFFSLMYPLLKRKFIIQLNAMLIIHYYLWELFFHWMWDLYWRNISYTISKDLDVKVIHEFIEFITLTCLICIIIFKNDYR